MADVQAVVDKWTRNTLASVPTITAGVMAVRESPTSKAADQAELYARKTAEAVASGKFQDSLRAVSLQSWQQSTVDKVKQRLPQGVNAAKSKVQAFQAQLQPHAEMVKRTIAGMPKGTEADADQRVLTAIRLMRQFKFQRRSA
jgi:uncharacterized membrane protein